MSANSSSPDSRALPEWNRLLSRLRAEWWAVGIGLSVLVLVLLSSDFLGRIDNLVYDTNIRNDQARARSDIVLVTVDDPSLDRLGAWPWPRERLAELTGIIADARPASIAFNILLAEHRDAGGDVQLAKAFADARAPVFLSMAIENTRGTAGDVSVLLPPSGFLASSSGLGHTSLVVDPDGLVRRAHLALPVAGETWPNLMKLSEGTATEKKEPNWPHQLLASTSPEPALISYAPVGRFATISAHRLIENPALATQLRGRIVLVGVTATGVETAFSTPLSGRTGYLSGTEIEAHLLSGLLDGRQRSDVNSLVILGASLVPLWLMLVLLHHASAGRAAICGPALFIGFLALGRIVFVSFNLWIPPSAGLAGLILVYPLWAWRRLIAIMAFMGDELAHFQADSEIKRSALPSGADPLVDRARLLATAIDQALVARQFIGEVIQQLPSPALVVDVDGRIMLANAAAYDLYSALGIAPPLRSDLVELLRALRLDETVSVFCRSGQNEPPPPTQIEVTTAQGTSYELLLAPLRTQYQEPHAWIVQLTDISAIKAGVREREEVLQLLTHDLRSPLVSILGTLERSPQDAVSVQETLIRRYAERALTLAEDFVMLAKAKSLQYAPPEATSLRLLLEDALMELQPQAEQCGVVLQMAGERWPWLVEGDQALLLRSLINLIGNALKHACQGRRVLCTIENHVETGRREVHVAVRDWGPGISADLVPTIFDKFTQAAGLASRHGAGLGLAFVAAVVRGHGGRVTCTSTPGNGSTFRIILPAVEQSCEDEEVASVAR